MWTHRKKQNLFYLFLGLLIGVALSCIVVSFQVIKRFTRDNLSRLQDLREKDTVQVVTYRPVARISPSEKDGQDTLLADSLNVDPASSLLAEDTILSDVRIASVRLSVPVYAGDSAVAGNFRQLEVEQWENPMHFLGYKRCGQTLLIYGMNVDEMEFFFRDRQLYARYGSQEVPLKDTYTFVRFPHAFLHAATEP